MKNAYQLVTDLHYGCRKANRHNYMGEILSAITDIIAQAAKIREQGYKVHLILLGDVCDVSINDPDDAMQSIEILRYFCSQYDSVYSVLGNHESTYYKGNPFWYLVSQIEDPALLGYKKLVQPKGIFSTIRLVDSIEDGDTKFYFNHYGTDTKVPTTNYKVNIGLFHKDIGSEELTKMWGRWEDVDEGTSTNGYTYAFMAHLHLAFGKYELNNGCIAEWLGSIGRTSIAEVDDSNLRRNIPVVYVEDGAFVDIKDNWITLQDRSTCVNEAMAEAEQKVRVKAKERKETSANIYIGSSLKETLFKTVSGTDMEAILRLCFKPYYVLTGEYEKLLETGKDDTDVEDDRISDTSS